MDIKDIVLLVLGGVVGVPASMIASLVVGPILNISWNFWMTKQLARVLGWTAPKFLRRPNWEFMWEVESKNFPRENPARVKLHAFLRVVAVEWTSTTTSGVTRTYRMVAKLTGVNKLTGRWFEEGHGDLGYLGALQVVFDPLGVEAVGQWIGFSRNNSVKSGRVELKNA